MKKVLKTILGFLPPLLLSSAALAQEQDIDLNACLESQYSSPLTRPLRVFECPSEVSNSKPLALVDLKRGLAVWSVGSKAPKIIIESLSAEPSQSLTPNELQSIITPSNSKPLSQKLDLNSYLRRAFSENLEIEAQRARMDSVYYNAQSLYGLYAPTINLKGNYGREDLPQAGIFADSGSVRTESWNFESSLSGYLPTGTGYKLSFNNSRTRTNSLFQLLSPQYDNSLSLELTQPLLKNLWIDDRRRQIKLGKRDRTISQLDFETQLQGSARKALDSYYIKFFAQENTSVARSGFELSFEQLLRLVKLQALGLTAPIEVLAAENEFALRKDNLLKAIGDEQVAENSFKAQLYGSGDEEALSKTVFEVQETTQTGLDRPDLTLDDAASNRPEFRKFAEEVGKLLVERTFLINQGLPQVDLEGSYTLRGLSGTGISSPFFTGTVPDRFIGALPDALSNLVSRDFSAVKLGLNITWPIAPGSALKRLKALDRQLDSVRLTSTAFLRDLERDLASAKSQLQVAEERIFMAEQAQLIAQKQLEAEQKKFEIGLSSNYFVIVRLNALIESGLRLVSAKLDRQRALLQLASARGTILEDYGLEVLR